MKSSIDHAGESRLANYRTHSLENFCPMLKRYLRKGMSVLDVGCGPGSVTANIAHMIGNEGTIIGIDQEAKSLDEAKTLCAQLGLSNATFMEGDAYDLPFEDERFDLVFSSAVLEYLREPVRALRQKSRVTRRGGYVIARAGDFGTYTLYPPCPTVMKILHANLERSARSKDRYFNAYVGRELYDIFRQANLENIAVEAFVPPLSCNFPGSEYFSWRRERNREWFNFERIHDGELYRGGEISDEDIENARVELEGWFDHPGAFFMIASVVAVGQPQSAGNIEMEDP